MLEVTASNVGIGVTDEKDGAKVLHVVDQQSGIVIHIPFDEVSAKKIGAGLSGTLVIAPADALHELGGCM